MKKKNPEWIDEVLKEYECAVSEHRESPVSYALFKVGERYYNRQKIEADHERYRKEED